MKIKEDVGLADGQPKEARDDLAYKVKRDFDTAVRYKNTHFIGDYSVSQILRNCYDQFTGVVDCKVREAFGDMPYVNLTQLKVSALEAWLRDILFASGGTPFVVEPTPIPELNKSMEDEILDRVKDVLFGGVDVAPQTKEEMRELISREKKAVRELRMSLAEHAAKLMETEMWDQCVEGGYETAMFGFIHYLANYPYAAIEGPVPEIRTTHKWEGDKLKAVDEAVFTFNTVSPFDFFWSPDSTNAQDGSYVIVRKKYTRSQLVKMAKLDSYIKDNVVAALEYFSSSRNNANWLAEDPDRSFLAWDGDAPLEVLKYYGTVSGRLLKEYGITGLEETEYYDCIIHTLGHFTLKVIINPNPNGNSRPIYVTSYQKTSHGVVGIGIAQKIRDTEKAFHACLRGMIKNMEFSSGPIGEVDFTRIAQWITDDEVGNVEPYTINPVDPDPVGGGQTAYRFYTFPSNVQALQNVCQWFMTMADVITQIPASIHGQPVGTGANRTFRGMSMLYGNALKGVQSAISNVDREVVSPMITNLYYLNLKFNPNEELKGDAKIVARGASGLMERELKKNDTLEAAQIVSTLGQTGLVPPSSMQKAVDMVLQFLGLSDTNPDDVLKHLTEDMQVVEPQQDPMAMMAEQPPMPPEQQPQPVQQMQPIS